jgi:potassium voltage-gated channel Eag-related subfamily H protein 1/potassium voltage-gated channel Eag-related subfamily H protein 5
MTAHDSGPDFRVNSRYIVLLFYLKIPEVISTENSIIASLDLKRNVKALLKLILLLAKIFMLCNIAACCFFFISDNYCPLDSKVCPDCCWVNQVEIMGQPLKLGDWSLQYMFSLYWASTTMLTIGSGDITPANQAEVVYTVSAQFISCILFGFSINEVWSIIQERNSKINKIHSRLNIINVYMRDKNVSSNLKSRVNSYLSHFYHTKNLREKELESEVMSELTPSLRSELCYESYGCVFKTQEFFKKY